MKNPIEIQTIVDICICFFLLVTLSIYVFFRVGWESSGKQNVILYFNLVRISYVFSFGLCFLTGFILKEKSIIFIIILVFITGALFTSNLSFVMKNKNLYKKALKEKHIDSKILDYEF